MIRVLVSDPDAVEADGILRSVGSDLEACTPADRRLGTRAGTEVLERLRAFGDVPVGGAVVTPGGDLAAPFLIHLVIRSAEEAIQEVTIRRALLNGLRQAAQWDLESVAILPLGVGAGNLDAEGSARVMVSVLREHLSGSDRPRSVTITVAGAYEEDAFRRELARVFPEHAEPGGTA